MRLLQCSADGELSIHDFTGQDIPAYAILSHTWHEDSNQEVTLQDLEVGIEKSKAGYAKIEFCVRRAAEDGLLYIWVDTCCIDKRNAVELGEAINSMFRWYHKSARCYVYLSDVSAHDERSDQQSELASGGIFSESRWFKRGWTLQELLAPKSVEFFSREGQRLGDKMSHELQIQRITGIPTTALRGKPLKQFSIDERFLWAAGRDTTKAEDKTYCLLGIFGVHLSLIYGEGSTNAFLRLQRAIGQYSEQNQFRMRQKNSSVGLTWYSESEPSIWSSYSENTSARTSIISTDTTPASTTETPLLESEPGSSVYWRKARTLRGHTAEVCDVTFSPDGTLVASSSADKSIRLWDSATGEARGMLVGHTRAVNSVVFSPDGKLVASCSSDHSVKLWDLSTKNLLGTLLGHTDIAWAVVFSPDGKLVASCSDDRTIRLWDIVTMEARNTMHHPSRFLSIVFSPDGKLLASGADDGRVWFYDSVTGDARAKARGHSRQVLGVAFSVDGKQIASCSEDKRVRLWDLKSARHMLEGHQLTVWDVAFSPNGQLIVSGSSDFTVRLWDSATGAPLDILRGHGSWVSGVAFSPDGKMIASSSGDHTVKLWNCRLRK